MYVSLQVCARCVDLCIQMFGAVDVLVNNAAEQVRACMCVCVCV